MDALRAQFATLPGTGFGPHKVEATDDFEYHDPVDGSDTKGQGVRVMFEGGSRIVYRLSGTGTVGATLRVYIERYEPPNGNLGQDALADFIQLSRSLAEIEKRTGRKESSVVTCGVVSEVGCCGRVNVIERAKPRVTASREFLNHVLA
jgi:phosphoglucomutase